MTTRSPNVEGAEEAPSTGARSEEHPRKLSRRGLISGVIAGTGAASAAASLGFVAGARSSSAHTASDEALFGDEQIAVHGVHQAGIATPETAHVRYLSFALRDAIGREDLVRLFRILTADIESLASGSGPLADTEPELAEVPARLTVTVGVGPGLVNRVAESKLPPWLRPLPEFSLDQLDPVWEGGDLLLVLAADDPTTIAHAARILTKDIQSFATIKWRQDGFRRARGAEPQGRTMRNLMGQVDGTVNPQPEDDDFDGLVWLTEADGWLKHGSAVVIRRIRMELDTWDRVDRFGREQTIGRDLAVGAPLTGEHEFDEPDYEATDALGFTIIPDFAHIRRARSENPDERIYRRAVNYDDGDETGLLFVCYQRNPLTQFVPIQQRLDTLDLLNEWVTHVGSAVFAVLPGWQKGGMLGETLLA